MLLLDLLVPLVEGVDRICDWINRLFVHAPVVNSTVELLECRVDTCPELERPLRSLGCPVVEDLECPAASARTKPATFCDRDVSRCLREFERRLLWTRSYTPRLLNLWLISRPMRTASLTCGEGWLIGSWARGVFL